MKVVGPRPAGRNSRRGAVTTEYALGVALVTLVAALATTPLAGMLVSYFRTLAWVIDLPIP